jgi:hypothetical protein
MQNVTTVGGQIGIGTNALSNVVSGIGGNIGIGDESLTSTSTGDRNTALGASSLKFNTTGAYNTVIGNDVMRSNTTGGANTALGMKALLLNTTGQHNTAVGMNAGENNTTGVDNIFIGAFSNPATGNLTNAIVIGTGATVSTSNTMVFGAQTSTTKWAFGRPTTSYALQVGNTTSDGNGAYLSTGGTWTNGSSRDFKEDFEELNGEEILNKIDKLSVTKWKYKGTNETHIGPIAEEFKEQFNLGVKEDDKHISTIDASGIALKAIQMLRKENNSLKKKNVEIEAKYESQEQRIKALELLIQKLAQEIK